MLALPICTCCEWGEILLNEYLKNLWFENCKYCKSGQCFLFANCIGFMQIHIPEFVLNNLAKIVHALLYGGESLDFFQFVNLTVATNTLARA